MGFLYLCYYSAASSKKGLYITIIIEFGNFFVHLVRVYLTSPTTVQGILKPTKHSIIKRPCFWNTSIEVKPRSYFQTAEVLGASLKITT